MGSVGVGITVGDQLLHRDRDAGAAVDQLAARRGVDVPRGPLEAGPECGLFGVRLGSLGKGGVLV